MNQSPNLNNLNNIPAMDSMQAQPSVPVQPIPQVQPVTPAEPVPVQPVNPVAPAAPLGSVEPVQPVNPVAPVEPVQPEPIANQNPAIIQPNQDLQYIPTVEQSNEDYINYTQTANKVEEKSKDTDSINIMFVIAIFIAILAAMFFLFPMLFERI